MQAPPTITPAEVRRLAIEVQHLGAERPAATADGLLDLVRQLGAVQMDTSDPLAPTHLVIAFSRLGGYDPRMWDRLLFRDRTLFEYVAHAASALPTEDYPIHRVHMDAWGTGDSAWDRRVHIWMEANEPLRDSILARLAADGPLRTGEFELVNGPRWQTTAWPMARNVDRMLEFLWIGGRILPVGRWRTQRVWDLAERWLPDAIGRASTALTAAGAARLAAERALRALGVASAPQVDAHFTRFRYGDIRAVLRGLATDGVIDRVTVEPGDGRAPWPGEWWIHRDRLTELAQVRAAGDDWAGRTTLLSALDNLVADRPRTLRLFGFRFPPEPLLSRARRAAEATSVLPLLHGDRLIGRVRARFDRHPEPTLAVRGIRPEPNVPRTAAMARLWRDAIDELAAFLGATRVTVEEPLPERWRKTMAG